VTTDDGTRIPADSAHPILLDGSDDTWVVDSGGVDLFSVPLAAGATGAREHICRVGPGQVLLGLGSGSHAAAIGVLAVGLPDTQLVRLDAARGALLADPQRRATVAAWIDGWLAALTSVMRQPPLLAGEIVCPSTLELAQSGRLEAGLDEFHAAFLAYLRQRSTHSDETAQQQQLLKRHADDQAFGNALTGLASVLAARDDGLRLATRSDDPLADACQLVMDASAMTVRLQVDATTIDPGRRIEHYAGQANAFVRRVSLSGECWWREDAGPLLAFRRDTGSPVALIPAGGQGYLIVDPATATRVRLDRGSAAGLTDTAFMFFRGFPNKVVGILDLVRFGLAGAGRDVRRLLTVGALGGLLALFTPFATGLLIDSVIPSARTSELLQLVLLLLTATLGVSAFELTRAIAMLRIEGRMGNAAHAAIIERLLRLPAPFFRKYSAGDLAQRAFGIAGILQLLTSATQTALLGWIFGLFSYAYLFFVSWQLALLATVLVAVALLVTTALNWGLGLERQMFQVQGDIASRVFQILNGIAKLRACGAEKRAFSLWAKDFSRQKTLDFKIRRLSNMLSVFNAGYVVLTSLLLFAAVDSFMPDISTGRFLAFNTAFTQFLAATIAMISAVTASLNAIPLYERARPILEALPEVSEAQNPPGDLSGAIDISHVTFRYTPDGPTITNDLSIKIAPGEFVALVGPSGSGKSTVFRLLLGFEHPEAGAIYYDGQDLAGLDVGAVRRQLGVVLQSGKLMPGDIFTNIVGSSPLTLDDAWEAARMAGFDEDIKAMPMEMHTFVAEGAGTISGGQKQRLMVARAIVRKPRILLFDEASSALDNHTQAIVARSIERLNATRVVIAHRLSTIVKADRIVVIESGQVVESGTYQELMALNGRFTQLVKRQLA
jgi:NHLM bacteriocin system ABC transporter ATP-binding protein